MITVKKPPTPKTPRQKLSKDIPDGQAFSGRIGDYEDRYFIRIHDAIYSLDSPNVLQFQDSWTLEVSILDYQPIDLEITIKS